MSTWTDERHDQVRRRLNATDGALHLGWDDGLDEPMQEVVANAYDDIADALDEIERLRAESARRMVWLEREQKAHEQTRLGLIDMAERAARPEITDDMVEAAARQVWGGVALFRDPDALPSADSTDAGKAGIGRRYRRAARAALVAALNPGEGQ